MTTMRHLCHVPSPSINISMHQNKTNAVIEINPIAASSVGSKTYQQQEDSDG